MGDAVPGLVPIGAHLAAVEAELARLVEARRGRRELVEQAVAPVSAATPLWPETWGPAHVELFAASVKLPHGVRDVVRARALPPWGECAACTEGQVVRLDDGGREWSVPCRCAGLRKLVARIDRANLPASAVLDDWRLDTVDWPRLEVGDGQVTGPDGAVRDRRSRARVLRADGEAVTIPVEAAVRNVVDGWRPGRRGLILQGANGVGKSHVAAGLARDLLFAGVGVRWTSWADHCERVKATFGDDRPTALDEARRPAIECDLLVLEELGGGRWTEWVGEQAEDLVYQRHQAGRTTVVTTNLSLRDDPSDRSTLVGYVGERAASRLLGSCDVAQVRGEDWRRRHLGVAPGGRR